MKREPWECPIARVTPEVNETLIASLKGIAGSAAAMVAGLIWVDFDLKVSADTVEKIDGCVRSYLHYLYSEAVIEELGKPAAMVR